MWPSSTTCDPPQCHACRWCPYMERAWTVCEERREVHSDSCPQFLATGAGSITKLTRPRPNREGPSWSAGESRTFGKDYLVICGRDSTHSVGGVPTLRVQQGV